MKGKLLALVMILSLSSFANPQIVYNNIEDNYGVNVFDISSSTWKSKVMYNHAEIPDSKLYPTDQDFFEYEYGEAMDFKTDFFKKYDVTVSGKYEIKDGALQFNTGKRGFNFALGSCLDNPDAPSIRFGSNWGRTMKDSWYLELEIEQDTDQTDWIIYFNSPTRKRAAKSFQVKGTQLQTIKVKCGHVGSLLEGIPEAGFQLECRSPGVNVRIKSIKARPFSGDVFYRSEFEVPFKPLGAKISFMINTLADYELMVNGQIISHGDNSSNRYGVITCDIAKALKQGRNVIAFRNQFVMTHRYLVGSEVPNRLLIEGICYDEKGDFVRILSGSAWRVTYDKTDGWEKAGFDDSRWSTPKETIYAASLANGKKIAFGFEPSHMGIASAVPFRQKYPVFDFDASEKGFTAKYPDGLANARLVMKVRHVAKPEIQETVEASNVRNENGFTVADYFVKSNEVGPWNVFWELRGTDGKLIDSSKEELVLVGPIQQDHIALKDFEKEMSARCRLVQEIDCTKDYEFGTRFMSHSGMNSPSTITSTKVVNKNGLSYRETGAGRFSWIGYTLDTPDLGDAYLLEIMVPDNDERSIYAGIMESFAVENEDNPYPLGSKSEFNASGAIVTGGLYKPSNMLKKLTIAFYPSVKTSSVAILSEKVGKNAAVASIKLYKVEGGLPALSIPETNRELADHNERSTTYSHWTAASNIMERGMFYSKSKHTSFWTNWYQGIERKIKFLKFQGQNASVEGLYMYNNGYPSMKHDMYAPNDDVDLPYLMMRMYKKNGIGFYAGFEYNRSPWINLAKLDGVSDRRIELGEKRGVYTVDKNGRQLCAYAASGMNFMAPAAWDTMMDVIREIYQRYEGLDSSKGLFLAHGFFWMPGFLASANYADSLEVGYDDDSIDAFEKDTGIKLNTGYKGVKRFMVRYELLTGQYRAQWIAWRKQIMEKKLCEIRDLLCSEKHVWPLALSPNFSHNVYNLQSPYSEAKASPEARNKWLKERMNHDGESVALAKEKNMSFFLPLGINPDFKGAENDKIAVWYGMITNSANQQLIRDANAVYLSFPLYELDYPAKAAPRWLWARSGRGGYLWRYAGDYAFSREILTCRNYVPRMIIQTGIDCNAYSGQSEQSRRFSKAFFTTPELEFSHSPSIRGIRGGIAKNYMRLVNDTPETISGSVSCNANFVELVYDQACTKEQAHNFVVPPYSSLVFKADNSAWNKLSDFMGLSAVPDFKAEFRFPPEAETALQSESRFVLEQKELIRKIPSDNIEELKKLSSEKDVDCYKLWDCLNNFEIKRFTFKLLDAGKKMDSQKKLLEGLAKGERVGINLACETEYVDESGRTWLADQKWNELDCYGIASAQYADRGDMKIENTKAPRVYQTEAFGSKLTYYIPVPQGNYNIYIHSAETWNKKSGRRFNVICGGRSIKDVNPVLMAPGFARPWIGQFNNVSPANGLISIEFSGNVAVNAIEIEKSK